MMQAFPRYMLLASFLAVAACGASLVPSPVPADVARVQSTYPDATLAELERGRQIYLSRCTGCHTAISPASISAARWPAEVREMSARAHLGADESSVIKYLVAQSLGAKAPSEG